MYVGHSISLYNRVVSYFMPSIFKTKERRVLRYLNKYGFTNIRLILYIMDASATIEKVVELEQHFIDSLNPNLNVDLVATSSGYHEPMSQEMRDKLRKERGIPVYFYEAATLTLLHVFESKQYMYKVLNMHHGTLSRCLELGKLYLDTFFLSLDKIEESTNINLLTLDELKTLVNEKREKYKCKKHPAAKTILAENIKYPNLKGEYSSINELAKALKGDRSTLRKYVNGTRTNLYRGQ
jgi:hypothetical protein